MTQNGIWVIITAVILTTGLLASSIPISDAQGGPSAPCPPTGKFVDIEVGKGGPMGPFEIDSYTYSSTDKTFMFTHEPDGADGLSGKIDDAIKSGDQVDIHFTSCKKTGMGMFKTHTVWLTGGTITDVSETAGDDDDFPTEKATGTFDKRERMTETGRADR